METPIFGLATQGLTSDVIYDDTTSYARDLGTLTGSRSFSDSIGGTDISDYYRFNVTTQSSFSLTLNGLSSDADVQLLDVYGGFIQSSTAGGTTAEAITRTLNAGTYYVRVYPYSGSTNYNLSLTATAIAPVDYAGNTLTTARNIGTLSGTQSFSDWVGSLDSNDYYRFNVTTQSSFSLAVNGLSSDADVQLLDINGGLIQSSTSSGTTAEAITRTLNAGTYYVRVYPYSGSTNYNLSLTATAVAPVDNAGNTLTTARNIGTLSGTQSFSDWVGSLDTNDYYRFNLTAQSNFSLALNGLSSDADVQLLDVYGGVIQSSTYGGTTSEAITRQLSDGTYYVRVYPYSGNTNYNLSLTATAVAPPDYAGNTLATARDIGTLNSLRSFSDWVGSLDSNDYYRFNVTTQSNFSLALNGLSSDADIQLLNSLGTVIGSSTAGGTSSESLNSQLSAGTYYVRVYPYSGSTNYNLSLNATPVSFVDNAGNTLPTARNIGTLSGTQNFTDWVGTTDTNDYYRFNVTAQSNFSLILNGLSSDADVQLIQDLNNNGIFDVGELLESSYNSGTTADTISRQLNTGTYYVRVYPYSGNTTYNLSLTATAIAPADYAGNTLTTARNIGTLSGTQSFTDWVGSLDTNDYYRFNVTAQSNFSLALNGLSADADVQLIQDFNNNGIIDTGDVLQSSTADGTTAEAISRQLNAGTYFVRVYPYSGNTTYNLSLTATPVSPSPTDWYSQNLLDAEIQSLTRSLGTDGNLSRNDMISIFRNAQDGNIISANELTDLRTIITNSSRFTMADFVRVLSNKIANGDVANTRSGFGNLFAGSSSTQMESLIGKWFLGNDRPELTSSSYSYRYVSGSLFQSGPGANDINQNYLGDCYYLATLSSIALEKPAYIQNMFIDNGDNTFTVRFYNNGVADYVTVDRYLPTNSSGYAVYAGWGGGSNTATTNELWVALAERAYAQLAESGWSRSSSSSNSYLDIEGGWMDEVIRQVTGLSSTSQSVTNMTQTQLINLVNSNQILTAGFVYGAGFGVVDRHAYTITSYNSSTGTFYLRNPWGTSDANVTWSQLLSLRAIIQWSNT